MKDQTPERSLLKPNHSFEEWWKNQLPPKSNEEWWKDYFNDPVVNSIVKYARYHSLYGWTARDAQVAELEAALKIATDAMNEIWRLQKGLKHPSDCLDHTTDGDGCDCGKEMIGYLSRHALKTLSRDSLKSEEGK